MSRSQPCISSASISAFSNGWSPVLARVKLTNTRPSCHDVRARDDHEPGTVHCGGRRVLAERVAHAAALGDGARAVLRAVVERVLDPLALAVDGGLAQLVG